MEIDSLTLEEKVGQLFIVGFQGNKVTGKLMHLITYFNVGGIHYTKENVQHLKQLHKLSTYAQYFAQTKLPLFLAVTQRGGEHHTIDEGLTISPSQATIAKANNRLYTKQIAEVVAKELRSLGINMNFAPVLHGHNAESENFFGTNIDQVAKHGIATIQGYQKEDVCAVATLLPEVSAEQIETISLHDKTSELYPFFRAIKHDVSGIVVPASLFQTTSTKGYTEKLLQQTLRDRAGYEGLFITKINLDEANALHTVILAIEAGVDLIEMPTNYEKQITIISKVLEAVKTGKLKEEMIDRSVKRILTIKKKYNVGEIAPFDRDAFKRKRAGKLLDRLIERATVSN